MFLHLSNISICVDKITVAAIRLTKNRHICWKYEKDCLPLNELNVKNNLYATIFPQHLQCSDIFLFEQIKFC